MSKASVRTRSSVTLGEALGELSDSMDAFGDQIGAVNSAVCDLEAATGRNGETRHTIEAQ